MVFMEHSRYHEVTYSLFLEQESTIISMRDYEGYVLPTLTCSPFIVSLAYLDVFELN